MPSAPAASDTHTDFASASPTKPSKASVASTGDVTGKLKWYYSRFFPASLLARWLRYGDATKLSRREISFTLAGEIYVRWKSFTSATQFHDALKTNAPMKLDIGAVYTVPPCDRHLVSGGAMAPVEKELVFDIDMTDYADVLGEVGGGNPVDECDRAWPLMAAAVDVLWTALTEDFGFKHVLCVYSGRRGVHLWVADGRARRLTNEQRSAIADFLYIRFASLTPSQQQQQSQQSDGPTGAMPLVNVRKTSELSNPLHPSLLRARDRLEPVFRSFSLRKAGVLKSDSGVRRICQMLSSTAVGMSSDSVRTVADRVMRGAQGDDARWDRLEREVAKLQQRDWSLRGGCDFVILMHTYPRLDANVSRDMNHLLKAPFSVHPKTGRVCVPFKPEDAPTFRPEVDAPRIDNLLTEMSSNSNNDDNVDKEGDIKRKNKKGDVGEHTMKLQAAVETFKAFVDAVEKDAMAEMKDAKMEHVDAKAANELLAY